MIVKLSVIVVTLLTILIAIELRAEVVESYGEAKIINNDFNTARDVAISRAKWQALESVSKVKVKIDTILVNTKIADEAVKTELEASVANVKIISEGKDRGVYWVKTKVDVDKIEAQKEINVLAKDTAISVVLPLIRLDGRYEFDQPFSLAVMNDLAHAGFEVRDVAGANERDLRDVINKAIATDNYELLNFLSAQYFSSTLLIGKIRVTERDKNAGYSKLNFSVVDGELDWKLIGNKKGGRRLLLKSGTYKARGQGSTAQGATNNLYENLAKSVAPKLVSDVSEEILGENYRSVMIVLAGQQNIRHLFALKKDVGAIPFVLDAKEQGMDTVIVNYPEKTYYLASFLTQTDKYRILKLGKNEIVLERK